MLWQRNTDRPNDLDPADREFQAAAVSYLDELYAVGVRLTRNRTEAHDLVQDTYVKALRARHQFQEGTNLRAWLLRIMTNTFLNRYRRGTLEKHLSEGPSREVVAASMLGAASLSDMRDPERLALRRRLEAEILKALDELPEDFRLAVLLSDVEELSYKEIAEIMGCPVGTVMSRLHRGRRLLRERLVVHAEAFGIIKPPADAKREEPVSLLGYKEKKGYPS